MAKTKKDHIFSEPMAETGPFIFDNSVAEVFSDMLQRSVPGYDDNLRMIEMFAGYYARPNANYYDLGSSLGAATLAMKRGIKKKGGKIFAIDNSPAMIRRSREFIPKVESRTPIRLICADIRDVKIKKAAIVILNYTLQFVDPAQRDEMIRTIYSGLLPGGILLLSEKMIFEESEENDFQMNWYWAFKKFNGYSQMEISQKRNALENVLIPETWQDHKKRLTTAGFQDVYIWQQFFNFTSVFAKK